MIIGYYSFYKHNNILKNQINQLALNIEEQKKEINALKFGGSPIKRN